MQTPPYASCLLFELYKSTSGIPYIQLFYKKSPNNAYIVPLSFPGCGIQCPLANLYQVYEEILPTKSFEEECALREGETLSGRSPEFFSL